MYSQQAAPYTGCVLQLLFHTQLSQSTAGDTADRLHKDLIPPYLSQQYLLVPSTAVITRLLNLILGAVATVAAAA
jgi:hypothetical protein